MSMKMKFGSKDIPFVYKGDKLIYPNVIQDGLLLHYDFKAMSNTDSSRQIAEDLSGNCNHGDLHNFNFTEESGYVDGGLKFDGVDDEVIVDSTESLEEISFFLTVKIHEDINTNNHFCTWGSPLTYIRTPIFGENQIHISIQTDAGQFTMGVNNLIYKDKITQIGFVVVGNSLKMIVNGEIINTRTMSGTLIPQRFIGLGKYRSDYFASEIFSTMLYNRPLSEEEIQHNYQIEKERHNL